MTDILETPSRTQLSFTMPFQMKVLEMHRKQSTPPPQLQLSHAANWRRQAVYNNTIVKNKINNNDTNHKNDL